MFLSLPSFNATHHLKGKTRPITHLLLLRIILWSHGRRDSSSLSFLLLLHTSPKINSTQVMYIFWSLYFLRVVRGSRPPRLPLALPWGLARALGFSLAACPRAERPYLSTYAMKTFPSLVAVATFAISRSTASRPILRM